MQYLRRPIGRSYRPEAFWFRFECNIVQNRNFHSLRGRGILDCDFRGKIQIHTVFFVLDDVASFVSGVQKKGYSVRPKPIFTSQFQKSVMFDPRGSFTPNRQTSTRPIFNTFVKFLGISVWAFRGMASTRGLPDHIQLYIKACCLQGTY